MKKFFTLSIAKQVLVFAIFGVVLGLMLRFNIAIFNKYGLSIDAIKLPGELFLRLVKMSIVPLVFFSVSSSVLSVRDTSKMSKIGIVSFVIAISTTIISVIIGLCVGYVAKPGDGVSIAVNVNASNHISTKSSSTMDSILNIVPNNIVEAMQKQDLLQIIFFAIFFSICILSLKKNKKNVHTVIDFISIGNDVSFDMIKKIMHIVPFAVCSFVIWIIATQDLKMINAMIILVLSTALCTILMIGIFYPMIMLIVFKLNPIQFLKKMIPVQILASATTSSAAALPLNMETAINKIGISKDVANFAMPIGATCNMNGCAFSIALYIMFTTQIYDISIMPSQVPNIILLCTLGAVGTPPIHGGMLIMVSGILATLNYPLEIIGILLTIDKLSATIRVMANVTGNAFMALITDLITGGFNKKIYKSNNNK